jgi:hypothetical protein
VNGILFCRECLADVVSSLIILESPSIPTLVIGDTRMTRCVSNRHSFIIHILLSGHPSQVRDMVVQRIAIDVIYLRFVFRIRDEIEGDEATHEKPFLHPVSR